LENLTRATGGSLPKEARVSRLFSIYSPRRQDVNDEN
jgi:hypothetical protein